MNQCRKCGQPIAWLETKAGKKMPVNITKLLKIVTKDGDVVSGYESHFATCPEAEHFRMGRA